MGRIVTKAKFTNFVAPMKSVEVEALIDTGATLSVLPQNLVDQLDLQKIRDLKTRYANNAVESKSIYGAVTVEILGRTGTFDVLAEPAGSQPLIGQVVLEVVDLVVDSKAQQIAPNPRSPEIPMIDVL